MSAIDDIYAAHESGGAKSIDDVYAEHGSESPGLGTILRRTAKSALHEGGLVARGAGHLVTGGDVSDEERRALRETALPLAVGTGVTALTGGLGAGLGATIASGMLGSEASRMTESYMHSGKPFETMTPGAIGTDLAFNAAIPVAGRIISKMFGMAAPAAEAAARRIAEEDPSLIASMREPSSAALAGEASPHITADVRTRPGTMDTEELPPPFRTKDQIEPNARVEAQLRRHAALNPQAAPSATSSQIPYEGKAPKTPKGTAVSKSLFPAVPGRGPRPTTLMGGQDVAAATDPLAGIQFTGKPVGWVDRQQGKVEGSLLRRAFRETRAVFPRYMNQETEFAAGRFTEATGAQRLAEEAHKGQRVETGVPFRTMFLKKRDANTEQSLEAVARVWDRKLTDLEGAKDVTGYMMKGLDGVDPARRPVYAAIKEDNDQLLREFQKHGRLIDPEKFREHYFGLMWKDPAESSSAIYKQANLSSPTSMFKQKEHELYAEGLRAGLTPVTTNPIRMQFIKRAEASRWVAEADASEALLKAGKAIKLGKGTVVPKNWVEYPRESMLRGHYGPEGAALITQRFLSKGIAGNATYKVIQHARNTANLLNFALSQFHLTGTVMRDSNSAAALGLRKLVYGDLKGAITSGVKAPLAPFLAPSKIRFGNAAFGALEGKGDIAPWRELLKTYFEAGGQMPKHPEYFFNFARAWRDAVSDKDFLHAVGYSVPAGIETMNVPLFQKAIPGIVLHNLSDRVQFVADRLGPEASFEDMMHGIHKEFRGLQNVFGQVTTDNWFMKKTLRDMAIVSFRAFPWRFGSVNQILGGAYDVAKGVAKTGMYAAGKAARPTRGDFITERSAYALTLPLTTAFWGTMYAALHGINPSEDIDIEHPVQSMWNLTHPRTGRQTGQGTPERISLPDYFDKDVYQMMFHPGQYAMSGWNEWVDIAKTVFEGHDPRGVKVGPAGAIYQGLKPFVFYQFERGSRQDPDESNKQARAIESFLGFSPASREITDTAPWRVIANYQIDHPKPIETEETYQARQEKGKYIRAVRDGKYPDLSGKDAAYVKEVASRGLLSPLEDAAKRLPADTVIDTFGAAVSDKRVSDEDRQMLLKLSINKLVKEKKSEDEMKPQVEKLKAIIEEYNARQSN